MAVRKVADLTYRMDDFTDPWVTATAVLLQHGYCRNDAFRYPWVPVLASHYRVLRHDLRDCGDSQAGDVDLDLDALVRDLLTVIEAAGIGPPSTTSGRGSVAPWGRSRRSAIHPRPRPRAARHADARR